MNETYPIVDFIKPGPCLNKDVNFYHTDLQPVI